ncbi:MAG: CDP-glucose 4,6-dehydratase [Woeseiaceae bacterium]|nr:CDP-glucose 4,6-dehydratase [Woeseiaceae bacterium]
MTAGEFWRGRRVLVTGHTGFKGSWLSTWLVQLGADVTGMALEPYTDPAMFSLLGLDQHLDSRIADIRDLAAVQAIVAASRPEIIIHMAAQALVRESYSTPVETFNTNVMGTAHVLEAARGADSVGAVVVVTSDKCYENREWVWGYRENDAMGGHDPYSASKGCAELVTTSYRQSFGDRLPVASARAGNVIGGGDWADDRLIPDMVRAIEAGRPVEIRNPAAIRPWQHVLEPLSGYMMLAERVFEDGDRFAGAWNFGPAIGDTQPVSALVERLSRNFDALEWNVDTGEHPHEAHFLKLDISKAVSELGYRPRVSLETALDWTAEWYQAYFDGQAMLDVTRRQIDAFTG